MEAPILERFKENRRDTLKPTGLKKTKIRDLLLILLIITVFFLLLNQGFWRSTSIRSDSGTPRSAEFPWVLKQGETVLDPEVRLPLYLRLEPGTVYTLTRTISYDGTQDRAPFAFFHVDHMYCRVYLEDEVLFSCLPEDIPKWDRSKSPGFVFKAFPMPDDCMGKEMKIEVIPALDAPMEFGLPDIRFGDFTTTLHDVILRDVPHDVVTILCILLGFFSIIFAFAALKGDPRREVLHIGIFSLLFSLYMITECDLNVYFIANPYYIYLINFISFSLMPISFLCFMRERIPSRYRKHCLVLIAAESILAGARLILHFAGVSDLREYVVLIHLTYLINIVMAAALIRTIRERKKRQYLILQLFPVVVGVVMDGVVYWLHLVIGVNDATFTILGVMIMLLIEIIRMIHASVTLYTESVKTDMYRKMAYVDELTGIGNRRAYDQEIQAILSGERKYDSLIVATADLNNLKYVNDHYGHGEGDALIRGASEIMTEFMEKRGVVFRTGGDEFSIFLYDTDLSGYREILNQCMIRNQAFNEDHPYEMSLAIGHVQIQGRNILEAVKEADARMYEDKARKKQEKAF